MTTDPLLRVKLTLRLALVQARHRQPARVGHLVVRALTRPIMGATFSLPWWRCMVTRFLLMFNRLLRFMV